jgi:hypothetical protein
VAGSCACAASGTAAPAAIPTANPIGLIVSGGMKIQGEASGSGKFKTFEEEGWIK